MGFCRAVFAGCADGRQPRYADADADDCCFDRHGYGHQQLDSRRLGEKRPHEARDAARHGILIEVIGWLLFVIVGLFFARMYIGMTNPKAEVLEMGTLYLRIVCTLSLGQFMSICFERMMQATGNTTLSMITQLSGAVTNIILDPILIFSCQMGIAGAAIATVIGQVVSCTVGFVLNQWKIGNCA